MRNDDVIALTGTTETEFQAICQPRTGRDRAAAQTLSGRHAGRGPQDKIAIVVDDGIATGATMRAALRALRRRKPRKLVLAVPVAPPDAIAALRSEVDEIVCLETPEDFGALGYFYPDFRQLADEDVIHTLDRLSPAAEGDRHGH